MQGATALLYAARELGVGIVKLLVGAISGGAQPDDAHISAFVNCADHYVRAVIHPRNHCGKLDSM